VLVVIVTFTVYPAGIASKGGGIERGREGAVGVVTCFCENGCTPV